MTAQLTFCDRKFTAPDSLCRTTIESGRMAFKVIAVSSRVSPLRTDEVATSMLITSAPSRLAATSKLVRVRVEFSKNRFMTVRPDKKVAPLVDGSVLVDVAFGKVEQARNGFRRKTFDAEKVGNLGTPMRFLSLKRDVKHAGAALARRRFGG